MVNYYELLNISSDATHDEIETIITSEFNKWRKRVNAPTPERRQQVDEMLHNLNQAQEILLDPAKRKAYDEDLANAHTNQSDDKSAQTTGETTNNEDQDHYQELSNRYSFHYNEGNYADAIVVAQEMTRVQPNNPYAWYDLALANFHWDNYADARYEVNHAISLKPNDAGLYNGAFYIYINSTDLRVNERRKSARNYIEKALAIEPEDVVFNGNLASMEYDDGYYQNAINRLEAIRTKEELTEFGSNILARSYLAKVQNEYATRVNYNNGSFQYYFTNPDQIDQSREYIQKAYQFAQTPEVRSEIDEVDRLADQSLGFRYEYKFLILIVIGALWFLSVMQDLRLIQMAISGALAYFGWKKFKVPIYTVNEKYVKSLR